MEIQTSPAELTAPHFDDETTIVSARPVVPIAEAKAVERSRVILWILPFVLMAAIFGALGALGINYFEHRQRVSVNAITQSPINSGSQNSQAITSTAPDSNSATSENKSADGVDSPAQSNPSTEGKALTADQNNSNGQAAFPKESASTEKPELTKDANDATSSDPGRLVRKRRVHLPTERNDVAPFDRKRPGSKRGAGRIQEIFQGPNP